MCGIVGFTGTQEYKEKVIKDMADTIAHRGPDGEGYFVKDGIALGHRRLAIIDLEGGTQPMISADEKTVVIFNGEIYNFLSLRQELEEAGHVFQTDHSDTEVLIHGYTQWGSGLLQRLRGMFSFAIWNTQEQSLFCARDHFGIKPFYYYISEEGNFLFGSEIKSFLKHPEFKKELNEQQLELYLTYQYSPGEDTFFKGVKKLMPAHFLQWKEHNAEVERYWQPSMDDREGRSAEELADEIEQRMKESVAAHKISDVEVGSFLSSGIDSSYITKLSEVDKTFTIGYKEKRYDESSYAQPFSKMLGIENYTHYIDANEYWDHVSKVQYHMDEPLADASCVSMYFLNREAAKYVKVCLSGEGADEMFGGYNVYKGPFQSKNYEKIPLFLRKGVGACAKKMPQVRGVNFIVRHAKPLAERYIGCSSVCTEEQVKSILKNYQGTVKPTDLSKKFFEKCSENTPSTQMQYTDLQLWMVGDILLKADKMSMANSLELRVPFLDIEVFETAKKVPASLKCNLEETKIALRRAALRMLPQKTADKKKLGFPVPIRDWLREEETIGRVRQEFNGPIAEKFFHQDAINGFIDDHVSGKRDNWRQIWGIYIFLVWYGIYFSEQVA